MKILLINKFLYPRGGAETYVFKVGEQLVKQRHEVEYFGMYDDRNIVGNKDNIYTDNVDFHEKRLSTITYPFKIIYSNENRKKLKQILERFQPDIVHLNNINFQLTPAIIDEIALHNIPIIQTVHDLQMLCPNHLMFQDFKPCERCKGGKYMECTKHKCIHNSLSKSVIGTIEGYLYHNRKTYEKVDYYICPSQFIRDKLCEYDPMYIAKSVFIQNFIELPDFNLELNKSDYILYFGRFYEEKGIRLLLDAVRKCPDIPFVFIGDGPLKSLLNDIPNIRYEGFKTGQELNDMIQQARLSIYPSIWYENCPLSVLESEALGTPVIASSLGGIPELIEEKKTGCIISDMNVDELVKVIKETYHNTKLVKEMSINCIKKRENLISLETYCKKLEYIYQFEVSKCQEQKKVQKMP